MKIKTNLIRFLSQISVFALILYLAWSHQTFGIEKTAPIDSYCPFGAMESLITLITTGDFLLRVFTSSFILMGIVLLVTLFFGRGFCGFLCPLGAVQEWIRFIGKKLGISKEIELPAKLDYILRYLKYLTLILVLYFSFTLGDLFFRDIGPFSALTHLGGEFDEKPIGYTVLIIILIISLFSKQWWCRYLCPLGGFLGAVRKISPFSIKRDKKTCIDCKACDRACPGHLKVSQANTLRDADCISCQECVEVCPKKSLSSNILDSQIKPKNIAILIILTFFIPFFLIQFTTLWQSKPASNIVTSEGSIDVENIRGSNTLKHVIEITGIPFEVFQKELNLPDNTDLTLKIKLIGSTYNIPGVEEEFLEVEAFREVITKNLNSIPDIQTGGCPFGEVEDPFPGKCGLYSDQDENHLCDLGQ